MNPNKWSSIIFLLLTLFITLALSGIPLLVSNHPARFEGFSESLPPPSSSSSSSSSPSVTTAKTTATTAKTTANTTATSQ